MRILLLDEGFMSGAYTAFGLGRAGCAVDVAAAVGGRARCTATGGTWRFVPRASDRRLMPTLNGLVRDGAFDVVYPVTEPLQRLVWDASPPWSDRVFPQVEAAQRRARQDKQRMSALMSEVGIPVPAERPAATDADVCEAVAALGLPVVIKGIVGRGGNATIIASSLSAAIASAKDLRARAGSAFAQEHVCGSTYLAGGVFDRGTPLRSYAGTKTVQFPARTGPAAELVSTHDPRLLDLARRAFAAARVSGIASADFVKAPEGDYQFLELNARPWGSITAAHEAGVDLFTPLVGLLRAHPEAVSRATVTPQRDYRAGVRSAVFPLYLLSLPHWLSTRAPRAAVRDTARVMSLAAGNPALAAHLAHRLLRVAKNW